MSQSRQKPSQSVSPSQSSHRRTSAASRTESSTNPRGLLPSPHFGEDPTPTVHQSPRQLEHEELDEDDENGDNPYAQAGIDATLPSFQPFFTLIEDGQTNEHYHPTVHYIFSDDDADIITEAACRSLDRRNHQNLTSSSQAVTSQPEPSDAQPSRLPQPLPGVREHYLILDVVPISSMHPQQKKLVSLQVTQARSLSAEWAVLRTNISNAPTMGDSPATEGEGDGLMLKIEGRGNTPPELSAEKDKEKLGQGETVEEMIERFQKRLEGIRLVMEEEIGRPAAEGTETR